MKYELWECAKKTSLTFLPVDENYEKHLKLLEPNSKLIWTLEADTYQAAMTLYYKKMDWGEYKPLI